MFPSPLLLVSRPSGRDHVDGAPSDHVESPWSVRACAAKLQLPARRARSLDRRASASTCRPDVTRGHARPMGRPQMPPSPLQPARRRVDSSVSGTPPRAPIPRVSNSRG